MIQPVNTAIAPTSKHSERQYDSMEKYRTEKAYEKFKRPPFFITNANKEAVNAKNL